MNIRKLILGLRFLLLLAFAGNVCGTARASDISRTGLAGTVRSTGYIQFNVPAGVQRLDLRTSGGTGDCDVYLAFAASVNTQSAPYRSTGSSTAEAIAVASPPAGVCTVLLYGYTAYSGMGLAVDFVRGFPSPPDTPLAGALGSLQTFQFNVPAGMQTLTVSSSGGTGDCELFLMQGRVPDASNYQAKSDGPTNNERIVVPNPAAGTWYLTVQAYSPFSGATLSITSSTAPPQNLVTPTPVLSLQSVASNSATIRWTWSGNPANASRVTLALRNLATNTVVSNNDYVVTTVLNPQTFNGLTPGTRYLASVTYRGSNGYTDGGATLQFTTSAGGLIPLPVASIVVSNPTAAGFTVNWSWGGRASYTTGIVLNVVNRATNQPALGYPLQLAVNRISAVVTGLQIDTEYRVTVTYLGAPGYATSVGTLDSRSASTRPRVVLLLHGMNSDPNAWKPFLDTLQIDNVRRAPQIYRGALSYVSPLPIGGVSYYRLDFGSLDAIRARTGVEGIRASWDREGDFTGFDDLGNEVADAVHAILGRHVGAQIVLVGHSRGGLAARAFLQNGNGNERASVIGLLTIGTPHLGSPLARIYEYLTANPRNGLRVFSGSTQFSNRYSHLVGRVDVPAGFQPVVSYEYSGAPVALNCLFSNGEQDQIAPIRAGALKWNPLLIATSNLQMSMLTQPINGFGTLQARVMLRDAETWGAADNLRSVDWPPFNRGLDLRRPTIQDLAEGSAALTALNRNVGRLPSAGIKYCSLFYPDERIGVLARLPLQFDVDIFPRTGTNPWSVSPTAKRFLIGNQSADSYPGDGIVPTASQKLASVPGIAVADLSTIRGSGTRVLHTAETAQTSDIMTALRQVAPWW